MHEGSLHNIRYTEERAKDFAVERRLPLNRPKPEWNSRPEYDQIRRRKKK